MKQVSGYYQIAISPRYVLTLTLVCDTSVLNRYAKSGEDDEDDDENLSVGVEATLLEVSCA